MTNESQEFEQFLNDLDGEIQSSKDPQALEQQIRMRNVMATYNGDDRMVSSEEIMKEIMARPPRPQIKTGLTDLDNMTGGFREQQVIVMSAPPKSGKTAMSMYLTDLMKEHNPGWIPLEQSAEELIEMHLERDMKVPHFYAPRHNKVATIQWIEKRMLECYVKYGTKIFIIDHMGYIDKTGMGYKENEQITKCMQLLKTIAKNNNFTIIVVSHITKIDPTVQPTVEHLYGTAGIHQEADLIIMLWRYTYRNKLNEPVTKTNQVSFNVVANRRTGETGEIKFVFENYKYVRKDWETIEQSKVSAAAEFDSF